MGKCGCSILKAPLNAARNVANFCFNLRVPISKYFVVSSFLTLFWSKFHFLVVKGDDWSVLHVLKEAAIQIKQSQFQIFNYAELKSIVFWCKRKPKSILSLVLASVALKAALTRGILMLVAVTSLNVTPEKQQLYCICFQNRYFSPNLKL